MVRARRPTGELETIPGVGPSIGRDLRALGFEQVEDLSGADPQAMYDSLCELRRVKMDRCVLYTFRCAAYFAGRATHDSELLKWWNWKGRESGW